MSRSFYRQWIDERWPVWAAKILKGATRLVQATLVGFEQIQNNPCAMALWHGDELALIPRFGHLGATLLVSHSKDGELLARATRALGYRVTRGSSTRGGAGGLIALIRAVRQGHTVVLAVDGPQGPREVCKPGVIRIAQKTRVPLYPVGVAVSRRYVFKKTWNRTYLPVPFARQVVVVDKPLLFSQNNGPESMEHHCRRVEAALREAQRRARALMEKGPR